MKRLQVKREHRLQVKREHKLLVKCEYRVFMKPEHGLQRGGGVLQAKWDIMVSQAPSFAVRHPCSKLCSYGSGFEERCRKPVIVVRGV